jgi:hypothetical protein
MKKKMIALLAAAMLTLAAASAFADFSANDLIRVVYNSAGNIETATDLGSLSTLLTVTSPTVVGGGTTAFTNAISGTALSGAYVAYFAMNTAETGFYASGSTNTSSAPVANYGQTGTVGGWMTTTSSLYGSLSGGTGIATTPITNTSTTLSVPNTYFYSADGLGSKTGTMGGLILTANAGGTELSLATLAAQGSLTQALYYLTSSTGRSDTNGIEELLLVTNANGSTTIEAIPAATPIPPSFFLMGSGLLGMFGLRRKQRA